MVRWKARFKREREKKRERKRERERCFLEKYYESTSLFVT
jgi:hypothetical protein